MSEETTTETQTKQSWDTSFDAYHKQRNLEATETYTATVTELDRVGSDICIYLEINELTWVVPLFFPETPDAVFPDELVSSAGDEHRTEPTAPGGQSTRDSTQCTDLVVFATKILRERDCRLSSLPGSELDVSFGESFETVTVENVGHRFEIRRPEDTGKSLSREDRQAIDLVSEYFTGQRGIETTLTFHPVADRDNFFSVSAPLTDEIVPEWEFDISAITPDRQQDTTFRLIEAAGGDPSFLADLPVYVLHASESLSGLEQHQIIDTDRSEEWLLVLPEDYRQFQHTSSHSLPPTDPSTDESRADGEARSLKKSVGAGVVAFVTTLVVCGSFLYPLQTGPVLPGVLVTPTVFLLLVLLLYNLRLVWDVNAEQPTKEK